MSESIKLVSTTKFSIDNCSGRRSKILSSLKLSLKLKTFKLFLKVFLRWLKAVFTILKKEISSQSSL